MKHLCEQNETYFSHLKFAVVLSIGFGLRSFLFLVHAMLPCIPVPKLFNVDCTIKWLDEAKAHIDGRRKR